MISDKFSEKKGLIRITDSILDAANSINNCGRQIALVIDDDYRLLGVVTDSDIRRSIIAKMDYDTPVGAILKKNPVTAKKSDSKNHMKRLMRDNKISQLPIIDDNGRLCDLVVLSELVNGEYRSTPVVIMAGGLGSRLAELTESVPKPLLTVNEKPILETIIDRFSEAGFRNIFISVNYKAEMIKDYFGDGDNFDVNIEYLQEDIRLGTAGALSLLPRDLNEPVLVMNGDILSKINMSDLVEYHNMNKAEATMVVNEYINTLPYGIIETNNGNIVSIEEKPQYKYLINAGIYVLNPSLFKFIPQNTYFEMTQLFQAAITNNYKTQVYNSEEYWLDIGQINDYKKAQIDYKNHFAL